MPKAIEGKHTPTPWSLLPARTLINIKGPSSEQIGQIPTSDEANAAFIVKAVNCHEELLEACKEALSALNIINKLTEGPMAMPTPQMQRLQEVIATAEKEGL